MKLLFLMELMAFDQATARAASVNRTTIRYQRALNATLLRRGRMVDGKSPVLAVHHSIVTSITTSCRSNAGD
jgi:hypothetical protein